MTRRTYDRLVSRDDGQFTCLHDTRYAYAVKEAEWAMGFALAP